MSSDFSHPEVSAADEVWHELDASVEEIARLADSEQAPPQFYAAVLDRITPLLAASGGAIWEKSAGAGLILRQEVDFPETRLLGSVKLREHHAGLLERVLQSGVAEAIPTGSAEAPIEEECNATDHVLLISPWRLDDDLAGVVELLQRPGAPPAAQRGYVRFLTVVCELIVQFHRNRLLRDFRHRTERFGQFAHFTERIHSSLDLKATAYHIANEGRALVGCDRLSVAVARGSRCRLLAVSGVDTVNRRANVVRELEQLSAAVAAGGEPLWHPASSGDLPPEIETPLADYLDAAHPKALAVIPLRAPGEEGDTEPRPVLGTLVIEQFHAGFDDRMDPAVSTILGHCGAALANAVEVQSVPLIRVWRTIGRARWLVAARRLPKTLAVLFAFVGVAIAMSCVPAQFTIEAKGELQPLVRREVFAPNDGVISRLAVDHGSRVRSGQTLVEIRRAELDFERQRVSGELQTASKKLAATEAERLQNLRQTEDARRRYGQLTADEEELRETIASLEKQQAVLDKQQAELRVASPIDGEVITWDLRQLLNSRPVARGQTLLTVADCDGPWVLDLRIPDDRVAHVLEAQRRLGPDLEVSFILATAPGDRRHGKLERVGLRAEASEADEPFVLATAEIDGDAIAGRVPGATVLAKIDCGRRAVGYVWFRDLIEAVQKWILF